MVLRQPFITADLVSRAVLPSGSQELDEILGGGLEVGLVHLLYGDSSLRDELMQIAVQGATLGGVVMIDSVNMINTTRLADMASRKGLEPEEVFRRIHVSRAFNSSQTYDLVANHLESFIRCAQARVVLLPGLVDIFLGEGIDAARTQQVTHMAAILMQMSLNNHLLCVVSSEGTTPSGSPRVGQSMLSCCQVHVRVGVTPMRVVYTLTNHPHLADRVSERARDVPRYYVTIPLDEFMDD